jgi:hypothetical protein
VHLEFSETVPFREREKEVEDVGVVWFREEALDDGYRTLGKS